MPDYTVGWVYNLHDPNAPTKAEQLIAIAITFPIIATLFWIVRFWLRLKTRQLGIDDWAALSSVILGIGYSAIAILQTRWGQALDPKYFPKENYIEFSKIQYAGGPTYCLAILGFKLSLLFSYLRLVGNASRIYSTILYIVVALVTINQIIFACLLSFACSPISKQWNPTEAGTCINELASYYALGSSSLGFDVLIICLPFPALLKLQLDKPRKIALILLFAFGFFITIIQGIRMYTIANLKTYTDSEKIVNWSIVEINCGVIISCIPTFGRLFRFCYERRSKVFSSLGGRGQSGHNHGSRSRNASNSRRLRLSSKERDHLCQPQGKASAGVYETVRETGSREDPGSRDTEIEMFRNNEHGILKTTEVYIGLENLSEGQQANRNSDLQEPTMRQPRGV